MLLQYTISIEGAKGKMFLFVLVAILGGANAQYKTCECGLFENGQFDESVVGEFPIPLKYFANNTVVTNEACQQGKDDNDCSIYCQRRFDDDGGTTVDFCEGTDEGTPRCTGSKWCEVLHNHGISNLAPSKAKVELYYRMGNCIGTQHIKWHYAWREVNSGELCCDRGEYYKCGGECETPCARSNLCECGAFIEEQFDRIEGGFDDGLINPIPLLNVGAEFGPDAPNLCRGWPSLDWSHACDQYCRVASAAFKSTVDLNAFYTDDGIEPGVITYGQFFCQALSARWGGVGDGIYKASMKTYGRQPGCPPEDDGGDEDRSYLRWNRLRSYTCHHQELCCNANGDHYNCPTILPTFPETNSTYFDEE